MSSDSDSESGSKDGRYCGIGNPTKKNKRATAEFCLDKKQVRYYGVVPVSASLLLKNSDKKLDLVTEQLKYRTMIDKRTIMLKKYLNAKVIAENDDEKPSKRATAKKEIAELRKRNVAVRARMAKQYDLIIKMERAQDEARAEEAERKKAAKKKSKSKDSKKSKSKDSKKSKSKDSKKKKTTSKSSSKAKKSGSKTAKSVRGGSKTSRK